VIERAAALAVSQGGVRLDEVTARLLDDRFEVTGETLVGERAGETSRLLLGKPTPCVGRDREIAWLLALADECARERVARVVLLVGPPGAGKSRIRHELVHALARRDEPWIVWIARGDPVGAGAHLDMIRQLVNASTKFNVRQHVESVVAAEHAARVADFLSELVSPQSQSSGDIQLRAARGNPVLMGDQMRLAWEDLLRAECSKKPVALVLEDLHWSDPATVRFIDFALGQLFDQPLFLIATARNEVEHLFPHLWENHMVHRVPVAPLGRKACEMLVRHVLGPDADPTDIVDQAAGNAFFLEELIRNAHAGRVGKAPATVVAMVQAQLEKLDPFARSVLRAASVFGQTFRRDALKSLLSAADDEVDAALDQLGERELLHRPAREGDLAFRHALVREAAYATLTPADAKAAHKLAGRFLEKAGSASSLVLAEHYERGADFPRAARAYARAAEQAIEVNDFMQAIAHANKALAFGEESASRLHRILAAAHRWRGEADEAYASACEAMKCAPLASVAWYQAVGELAPAGFRTAHWEHVRSVTEEILPLAPASETAAARIRALAMLARALGQTRQRDLVDRVLTCVDDELRALGTPAPDLVADVEVARELRAQLLRDYESYLLHAARRREAAREMGNLRAMADASNTLGFACMTLGDDAQAEIVLREGMEVARRVGLPRELAQCRANLSLVIGRVGSIADAISLAHESLDAFRRQADEALEASSLTDLAHLHLAAGNLDRAEQFSQAVLAISERANPIVVVYGHAYLARIYLQRGMHDAALEHAELSYKQRDSLAIRDPADASVDLAYASALAACGKKEEARTVAERARAALHARAAAMRDERNRRNFLENVPENKAILTLAARLESLHPPRSPLKGG